MSQREDFVMGLFDQYYSFLRALCWRYVEHEEIYADAVDESVLDTFLLAYLAYEPLQRHPNIQGWLITTCINRLRPRVSQMRSREAHQAFSMDDPHTPQRLSEEEWEDRTTAQLNARSQLEALYAMLTETERRAFQEHYVQGFTLREVAQRQHKSLASVKASVRQIKKKAKKLKKSEKFSE